MAKIPKAKDLPYSPRGVSRGVHIAQTLSFDDVGMHPFDPERISLLAKDPEVRKHGSLIPLFNLSKAKTTLPLRPASMIPLHLCPSMSHIRSRPEEGHQG